MFVCSGCKNFHLLLSISVVGLSRTCRIPSRNRCCKMLQRIEEWTKKKERIPLFIPIFWHFQQIRSRARSTFLQLYVIFISMMICVGPFFFLLILTMRCVCSTRHSRILFSFCTFRHLALFFLPQRMCKWLIWCMPCILFMWRLFFACVCVSACWKCVLSPFQPFNERSSFLPFVYVTMVDVMNFSSQRQLLCIIYAHAMVFTSHSTFSSTKALCEKILVLFSKLFWENYQLIKHLTENYKSLSIILTHQV